MASMAASSEGDASPANEPEWCSGHGPIRPASSAAQIAAAANACDDRAYDNALRRP